MSEPARKFRIVRPLDVGRLQAENEKRRLDRDDAMHAASLAKVEAERDGAIADRDAARASLADVTAQAARNAEAYVVIRADAADARAEATSLRADHARAMADVTARLDAGGRATADRLAEVGVRLDAQGAVIAEVGRSVEGVAAVIDTARKAAKMYRIDHGDGTTSSGTVRSE